jgi:hypothetical protein
MMAARLAPLPNNLSSRRQVYLFVRRLSVAASGDSLVDRSSISSEKSLQYRNTMQLLKYVVTVLRNLKFMSLGNHCFPQHCGTSL